MIKCKCWKCGNLSQCSSRIKGVHKNLAHIVSLAQPPSSTTSLTDEARDELQKETQI